MILPKGTTGFFGVGDKLPQVNPNHFSKACYKIVSETNAKVLCISTQLESGKNYYYAALEITDRSVLILCNTCHPLVSFAIPGNEINYEEFIDDAVLESVFESFKRFKVLAADILNAAPQSKQLSELSEAEISQIKYWSPKRLGEIVFNHWD
jgi:hypothetical protein